MKLRSVALSVWVGVALSAWPAKAQVPARPSAGAVPGSELTITLLTMGNGAEVWELFGHNAIWIHDASLNTDRVYNWGVFDMSAPHFIARFLQGTMMYRVDTMSLAVTLYDYRYLNRSVVAQELDLTPPERVELHDFVEWNMLPQNQFYRYSYFTDNCSTRVRDLLDRVLRGQVRAAAVPRVTNTSFRWHAMRLMQSGRLLVTGVDIGLGEPSDRPITRWDEMFLPAKLHDFVRTLRISDAGGERPLVRSERVLFQSTRPPEPDNAPNLLVPLLVVGLIVAVIFILLPIPGFDQPSAARMAFTILAVVWSLAAGILGVILTLLWTATDHVFSYRNENLLLLNPLWLALIVLLPLYVVRGKAVRLTRAMVYLLAALSAIALIAHVVRLSVQSNLAVIGLTLPPALALAWVCWRGQQSASAVR